MTKPRKSKRRVNRKPMMRIGPVLVCDVKKRRICWTITALLCAVLCCSIHGATNTAASASLAHVTTAYNACSNGDTLAIPAGAATWTDKLTVAKSITIRGVQGGTFITNGIPTGTATMFSFEPAANLPQRLSGVAIIQTNGFAQQYVVMIKGAIDAFRLDRCYFEQGKTIIQTALAAGSGPVFGLIDSNVFYNCSLQIQCFNYITGDTLDGDQMWALWRANPLNYIGTTNSMVVESNLFIVDNDLAGDNDEPMSGGRGSIQCWRNNTFIGRNTSSAFVGIDMHGAFAGVRGGCLYEVYSNTFYISTTYRLTKQRGGSWIVYGNTYYNTNGSDPHFVHLGAETEIEQTANASTGDGYTNSYYAGNMVNGVLDTDVVNDSLQPAEEGRHYFNHLPNSTNNFYPLPRLISPHPMATAQDATTPNLESPSSTAVIRTLNVRTLILR